MTDTLNISRRDAAHQLGVSVKTVDRLCTKKQLLKVAVEGRRLIERRSLDAYQASLLPRPEAAEPEREPTRSIERRRAELCEGSKDRRAQQRDNRAQDSLGQAA